MSDPHRKALKAFISCIESTGGCTTNRKGFVVPRADEEWSDLGEAYVEACKAMDIEPQITID